MASSGLDFTAARECEGWQQVREGWLPQASFPSWLTSEIENIPMLKMKTSHFSLVVTEGEEGTN